VPVYKYIQVSAAVGSQFMLEDTCEYIGLSILLTQFDKVAAEILTALDNLQDIQLTTETIEGFKKRIQSLRGRLHAQLASANGDALLRLHQMIRGHEQALAAKSQG
jgi:conjugative transfer pilus assembly protein TraH